MAHRVWTPAARAGHTGGEPPGNFGWLPLTGGSVEPPAEGIRKDTNGPDQASDADQHGAHLPGRLLVLANLDVVPALGLGHGPHLLSDSLFLPGKDTGCSGGRVPKKAPPACHADHPPTGSPLSEECDGRVGSRAVVRAVRPDGARRAMSSVAGQAVRL